MDSLGYELKELPVQLERVRVLEYFEGDRLVQLKSPQGEIYLKSWLDEHEQWTRWLLFRCTSAALGRFIAGVWTLRDLLEKHDDGVAYIVDSNGREEHVSLIMAKDFPDSYMPTAESYYDADLAPEGGEQVERILLDGFWSVEFLSTLDRKYRQVYAALAAFLSDTVTQARLATHLSKYRFKGGWIHVKVFDLLVGALPKEVKPKVIAFHYASPGVLEYRVEPSLASRVSGAVHNLLEDDGTIKEAYRELHKQLGEFSDWAATGTHDEAELEREQRRMLRQPSEDLAEALKLEQPSVIWQLTNGNYYNAGHILASYYRRIETLVDLHSQGDARISSVLQAKPLIDEPHIPLSVEAD